MWINDEFVKNPYKIKYRKDLWRYPDPDTEQRWKLFISVLRILGYIFIPINLIGAVLLLISSECFQLVRTFKN
jgi:hypothetical protein